MEDVVSITRESFRRKYAEGEPSWEIGKPQPPFVAIADQVAGPVLDAGCGTGNASIFFAARGLEVTGVDFVGEVIERARSKASERGLTVEFLEMDALTFAGWDRKFGSVIDSGLFHIYHGAERDRYVAGLAHVIEPGGRLYLFSFGENDKVPGGGVSRQGFRDAFADGWQIESLEATEGEVNPAHKDDYPPDTPLWFAIIRRTR